MKINFIEGKKGQADTLTWFVGTIIIFFVLAFFIGAVISIAGQDGGIIGSILGEISGGGDDGENSLPESNLENAKIIQKFLSENREVVSDWAEKSKGIEGNLINANEEQLISYMNFKDAWLKFSEDNSLEEPYFYARTSEKSIIIGKNILGEGYTEDATAGKRYKFGACTSGTQDLISRFFISSENGELVMIVFYQNKENDKGC